MMSEMDSSFKKKFDTTKMSVEDLKLCRTEETSRPPGPPGPPEPLHHQQGRPGLSKVGRYPVFVAGMAVLSGISTFMYYRSGNVKPIQGNNQSLQDSVHVATGSAPAD